MEAISYPINDINIILSPYVWKPYQTAKTAGVEATMPGAYIKFTFTASASCGIMIDATENLGCPPESMPVIEYSLDGGAFRVIPTVRTGEIYGLPLEQGLATDKPHRVELFFRAADLCQQRWHSPRGRLRVTGIILADGGKLYRQESRSKKAIGFGDSITEGVGVDGLFTTWQQLGVNNARGSWLPIVCIALDCEYGQLGSGGQGMVNNTMIVPPLPQTWDRYDATASRLTNGKILPEPDYIFCAMGTNDFKNQDITQPENITAAYTGWLESVRKACPHAWIFCVVPPFGWHRDEINIAVETRKKAGDERVNMIDTAAVKNGFIPGNHPSQLAYDGVHPSAYGNALLATVIISEIQKIGQSGDTPTF